MMLASVAALDPLPPYRAKWNFAIDTNFEAGVIYMGQMNPKESACLTMFGIVAWKNRDYNLAQIAFEKAITLNSPQAEFLRIKVAGLKDYIKHSSGISTQQIGVFVVSGLVVALLLAIISIQILSVGEEYKSPAAFDKSFEAGSRMGKETPWEKY